MSRLLRFTLVVLALVAAFWVAAGAQGTTGQKAPATAAKDATPPAKPAEQARPATPTPVPPEEYPADYKAFNEIAKEPNASKRIDLYEKFIADNPKSDLASMAKSQMQSMTLTVLRDAQKKYLDSVQTQLDAMKKSPSPAMNYSTYNRLATELLNANVLLDQAEEYARTGLSLMDEGKFIEARRESDKRVADSFAKRAASPPPAPTTPSSDIMPSFAMQNGVLTVRAMKRPPAAASPAPSRPPEPPRAATDDELKTQFKSTKVSAQATLGQILLKRGKADEAAQLLKDAYAGRPASYTMATVARALNEIAKKAGDDKGQLEYLTGLMLTGRINAAERGELEAVYRKAHGGSLDGIEEMLDERYRRENPAMEVTPFARKAPTNGRVVLAEMFTGAG